MDLVTNNLSIFVFLSKRTLVSSEHILTLKSRGFVLEIFYLRYLMWVYLEACEHISFSKELGVGCYYCFFLSFKIRRICVPRRYE